VCLEGVGEELQVLRNATCWSVMEITNYNKQITNNIQIQKEKTPNNKPYDLEERTLLFAKDVVCLCKRLPFNTINSKLIGQLIRSAGSVGANYREANEALSKKDFVHRMRITRKEAKESSYWLELIEEANSNRQTELIALNSECRELRNIFTSIIEKAKK